MHAPRSEDPGPAGGLARVTAVRSVTAAAAGRARAKRALVVERDDWIAHEEPLSIRVDGRPLGVVMRTPGHDLELVRGLLFAEGILERAADVAAIAHCRELPPRTPESWRADASDNVVLVTLARRRRAVRRRAWTASTSCGVCGRATIDELRAVAPPVKGDLAVDVELLLELPDRLREAQHGFARTGGLHAAGLFDGRGKLLVAREDVGRHNAVDKVVGAALLHRLMPLSNCILQVSGRTSFEIVQKARRAGIPIVCAVSAPSTLAIELARDGGQTLCGFARGRSLNVYCGEARVRVRDGAAAPPAAAPAAPSPAARRRPPARPRRSGRSGRR